MKLNTILIAVLMSIIGISFNACTSDDTTGEIRREKLAINVTCEANSTAADIATYMTTMSGDSIVQDETNTTISMFIDATNTKKVCLLNGKAHIERSVLY